MICNLPNFNEEAGDADGTELLIADCEGAEGTGTDHSLPIATPRALGYSIGLTF
jgi:hypothetical protein